MISKISKICSYLSFLIFIFTFVNLFSSISAGNWQNFGGDLQHSGYSDSNAVPLELIWTHKVGASDISAPIIDSGILFVGSDDNNLYALDEKTGDLKWQYSALGKIYTPTAKDGLVFAASFDNYIYALNYNGDLRWKTSIGYSTASPPISYDNILYGGVDKYIYAIYIVNGTEKWRYSTDGWVVSAPAISQGTIYAGSNDNKIYALDAANKNLRWSYATGGSISSSPSVVNGVVYVGSGDNNVYAIDSIDGKLKWNKRTNDWVKSSPAVLSNKVVVGSNDNAIYAFDSENGDIIWKYLTNGRVESPPVLVRNTVYGGSEDGMIYVLEPENGLLIDKYQTGGGIISMAVSDNMLFATSRDGYVYAFGAKMLQQPTIIPTVSLNKDLPVLRINPIPVNITSQNLTISGTAQDPNGILVVTVNGIDAGAETWKTTLTLSNGTNIITVIAVDKAGNIKTEIRTVRYIPASVIQTSGQIPGFPLSSALISFIMIVFLKKIRQETRKKKYFR
jgi:outer membrane protein assembly factor BamB